MGKPRLMTEYIHLAHISLWSLLNYFSKTDSSITNFGLIEKAEHFKTQTMFKEQIVEEKILDYLQGITDKTGVPTYLKDFTNKLEYLIKSGLFDGVAIVTDGPPKYGIADRAISLHLKEVLKTLRKRDKNSQLYFRWGGEEGSLREEMDRLLHLKYLEIAGACSVSKDQRDKLFFTPSEGDFQFIFKLKKGDNIYKLTLDSFIQETTFSPPIKSFFSDFNDQYFLKQNKR
ncbi:MAG: hypothetical protein PHE43_00055 [Candidatus Nanoarchaeia archaeon]|nr:hypothetical protein [Candidatus Nanoarchaeia archaeon]